MRRDYFNSKTWYNSERGRLSQGECFQLLAQEFSVNAAHPSLEWAKVRDILQPNERLPSVVRELKGQPDRRWRDFGAFKTFAPDYDFLRTKPEAGWSISDEIVASSSIRECKPNPSLLANVIAASDHTT
ncbi:hypothetical protein AcV7_006894 [Taiwanofungus camphoratus]|nr:hypothetical protein AcV7_006894 [Antrodia cinnamomea]